MRESPGQNESRAHNTAVVVVRRTSSGETRTGMKAAVDSEGMFLPVDADIEVGDRVDQRLVALSQSNRVSGRNW